MKWQDMVACCVSIALSYAMMLAVYRGYKTKKQEWSKSSSVINACGLYILTFSFSTDSYILLPIANFVTASLWLIILIQSIIYGDKK